MFISLILRPSSSAGQSVCTTRKMVKYTFFCSLCDAAVR
jgi:hypothetical protein